TPGSDPFAKHAPSTGFRSQGPTAIQNINPLANINPPSIATITTTGNLIQDPSFEASYGSSAYWSQWSYQFGTPLCTEACGNGSGTAGPRSGSVWVWFGGVPAPYDESAAISQYFTIPACTANAKLQFYLWIGAAQQGSGTDDIFYVSVDSGPALFT